MGKLRKPACVKLISGFIYKEATDYQAAKKLLEKRFGKIDFESRELDFVYTEYYKNEFGFPLKRKFISFLKLISPHALPNNKIFTNHLEDKFSSKGLRRINIDPGYLDLSKLVLATTKDFCHRIYLDHCIFGEITLVYKDKSFSPWEWTYPDYRTKEYLEIFNQIRDLYHKQIR